MPNIIKATVTKRKGAWNRSKTKRINIGFYVRVVDEFGNNHTKTFGNKERMAAEAWKLKKIKELESDIINSETVKGLVDRYFSSQAYLQSSHNAKRYWVAPYNNLKMISQFDMNIEDLNRRSLTTLMSKLRHKITVELGRPRKNFKQELELLSAAFNHHANLMDENFINPISKGIKEEFGKSKAQKQEEKLTIRKALSRDEMIDFVRQLKNPAYDKVYFSLAVTMLTYGFRLGEALGLEWRDVDFINNTISLTGKILFDTLEDKRFSEYPKEYQIKGHAPKDGKPYLVMKLPSFLKSILLTLKSESRNERYVHARVGGRLPVRDTIYAHFKRTGYFEERGMCSHKLRKTTATLSAHLTGGSAGREVLRHADDFIAQKYRDTSVIALDNPVPEYICSILKGSSN